MVRRIVVALLGVLVLAACGPDGPASDRAAPSEPSDAAETGGGMAMCADAFSVDTLGQRAWAFDGIVTDIVSPESPDQPYDVVFEVARWFHGGDAATATLRTYDVSGQSLVGGPPLEVGSRVLASGDDEYLWGCGYSMPFSQRDERLFERAFS